MIEAKLTVQLVTPAFASYVSLGERGAICANINLLYRQPRHAAGKSDQEGDSHLVNF